MSQPCTIVKCSRTSRGLCDCCQQQLCIQHLSEHNASLISQLNPLTDEINTLGDRLKTLDIHEIVGNSRLKLEKWRSDCHQQIDHFFELKCQELDSLLDAKVKKQRIELNRIQSKIAELISEQETTRQDIDSLTSSIHHLQEQMDKIEQTCLTIANRPLLIDDTLICIKETAEKELDLSTLPPVYKTISRPGGSKLVISASDRLLLMHRKPNLCFVDENMNIVKEISCGHDGIWSICWSSTLNRFIVVKGKRVFLVDEKTMKIDHITTINESDWLSCTCSDTFLFLVTDEMGSSVMKYSLFPSIELVMTWKTPHTCATDEFINDMVHNNGSLGLLIENKSEKCLRMELRHAETLDCIWSLRFDTVCNQNAVFRCCSLTCDEWLVADYETKRLLQISKTGKLKTVIPYDDIPYCVHLFTNMLVVSTNNPLMCHRLLS